MRPGAYPVWLSLNFASAFMESLVWTVVYVYYVTVVEMNSFELVLVGTVMESAVSYVGALLGIGGSVALALIDIRLAIAAGAAVSVAIAVSLAFLMPERGFDPLHHDNVAAWRGVARNALHGFRAVRRSAMLLVIVVITVFFGASTEALDRLTEAQFIRSVGLPGDLQPVVWFGIISVIGLVGGFLVATFLLRRLKPTQPVRTVEILLATDAVLAVALLVFAFAESFWLALVAYLVARRARGLRAPFFTAWLNQNTESSVRATVNSIVGQSDAIGQVAGGPMIGALGVVASLRAALASSAVLLLPALALYAHALRRGGRERVA